MADTRVKDLHLLPKFRDSLSYLYTEHSVIDRHENAIAIHDAEGMLKQSSPPMSDFGKQLAELRPSVQQGSGQA